MDKSKWWMLAGMALTLLTNIISGKAQEEQIKEEVRLALDDMSKKK